MQNWYAFRAYNSETVHGYGTVLEADRYCDHLNANRSINLYAAIVMAADEVAGLQLDASDLGFSLSVALGDVEQ